LRVFFSSVGGLTLKRLLAQISLPILLTTLAFGQSAETIRVDSSDRACINQATGGLATTSDPNSGSSLSEAIEKQLGLKLEMQKRPLPVLVIDHIEQKPTDN
jgi:uncharacterized protein (TIGR03435 family)